MSLALLEKVRDHINAAGLLTGYTAKFFRWTDADVNGTTPFILFRRPGSGGDSSILLQKTDVLIQMVGTPTTVVSGDARMQSILRLFRGSTSQTGVVRFDPVGPVTGPLYLENGRPVWELTVRCVTEDQ